MITDDQRKADKPESPEAGKAFDTWLQTDTGSTIFDLSVFRLDKDPKEDSLFFLRNKLRRAFEAGMAKGAQLQREKSLKRVETYLIG